MRLLRKMRKGCLGLEESNVLEPIRKAVMRGGTYIGASAGAMISGQDIVLAAEFDRNFPRLMNLEGLKLFDGTVIPHYSPEHLKTFMKNEDPAITNNYKKIYSVDEDEILVL